MRKPGNDKIVGVLKEIAEVLKASAMKAGMRPASDGDVMEFYLKVISMIDDEALLVLEREFDIDLGINAVNEGVSRWLRYCLLKEFWGVCVLKMENNIIYNNLIYTHVIYF